MKQSDIGVSAEVAQYADRQARFQATYKHIIRELLLAGRLDPWQWAKFL